MNVHQLIEYFEEDWKGLEEPWHFSFDEKERNIIIAALKLKAEQEEEIN